jgi:diphthamide biosynthesis methyltransferase
VILGNLGLGLHTLVFLDIMKDRFMTVQEGMGLLAGMGERISRPAPGFYVGVSRAGSPGSHPGSSTRACCRCRETPP